MRRHLLLLTFTLILSHFSILNLWGADYLIPVTPGTACHNSSDNTTDGNNRRNVNISTSGNYADFYLLAPSDASYDVYAGHMTPNSGLLHLYIRDNSQGEHYLKQHDWNTVDEANCGNRGFTEGSNKISLKYATAEYKATYIRLHDEVAQTTKTVPTSLDFYWPTKKENGSGAKIIISSDFIYDKLGEDHIKKSTVGEVKYSIFNANTTASSRDKIYFPTTGTYRFTFYLYCTESHDDYHVPYVFVNTFMAGGSTCSLVNGRADSITVEMDVTAGTYPIAFYIPYDNHSDRYHLSKVVITKKAPSCTAPNHVDITGNWDYFGGETISLTATAYSSAGTGSPIADANITGYQWKHNGSNISGATSKTLTITNCTADDGGDYTCVVSTGATCSTESSAMGTKVYALQCYTGGTTTYNFTRDGSNKIGTAEVTLTSGQNQFKIYAGGSQYYGNNTSAIYSDISNYVFKDNEGNFKLEAGLGGIFTFTIDYTDNGGAPKVSVLYPRKTIYLDPGVWNTGSAKFAYYYFISETVKGWTDFLTSDDCGMYADIPQWNSVKINAVRLNNTCTSPNWDDKWNQTSNITISSNNYVTITDWGNGDSPYSYGTYSLPTYTISYNKGSNTYTGGNSISGSKSDESKTCGTDYALPSSAVFTATGYTQTGWATEDGGSKVYELGDDYTTNSAQEFFPFWTAKTTSVTLNPNTGHHGTGSNVVVTATYNSALSVFSAAVPATGYQLTGYWTGETDGTKVINANGSFAANSGVWNREDGATLELYAQYEPCTYAVTLNTNDGTINAANVTSYTYGVGATLPTNVTKSGNRFMGWYAASNFSGDRIYTIANDATGNKEYWAKWTPKVYNITYMDGASVFAGTHEDGYPTTHTYGTATTLKSATKAGYTLEGWYTEAQLTNKVTSLGATAYTTDIMLYANWTPTSTVSTPTVSAASDTYSGTPIDISLSATSSACSNPVVVFFVNDGTTTFEVTGAPYGSDGNSAVGTVNGSAPYTTVHKATFTATKAATYTVTAKLYEGLLLANFDDMSFSGGYWESKASRNESEDNPEREADNGSSKVLKIQKGTNYWDCDLYHFDSGKSGYQYAHTRQYRTESGNTWLKLNDDKGDLQKNDGFTANTWQKIVYDNSGYDVNFFYPLLNTGNTIVYFDDIILSNESSMTVQATSSSASTTIAPPSYAIATSATNGSVSVVSSAAEGDEVTITATPSGGYEFSSWTITKTSDGSDITASVSLSGQTSSATFTMPAYGVTVTATFVAETCESGYTLEVEDDFVIVTPGDGARSTPQKEGWYNTGWYTGFHGNGFYDMKGDDGEIYLPVHLNGGTYSFTIYHRNGSNKELRIYSKTSSANTTISYLGSTYYRMSSGGDAVTGGDGGGSGDPFVYSQINNKALSAGDYIIGLKSDGWASWDQVVISKTSTYTVSYNATGAATGSTISAKDAGDNDVSSGSSVSACTEVTFTASPASGYVVEHWQVGGVTYAAFDGLEEFTLAINRNVTVTYTTVEASAFAVTVNTNNALYGSANAGKAEYESGETVTLTATPETDYGFVNWTTSDGVSFVDANAATTTFTMPAKAVTVTANFAELRTVNFEVVGGNGSISAKRLDTDAAISSGAQVPSGTRIRFTATQNPGYNVQGWYTYENGTEVQQGNDVNTTFDYTFNTSLTIRVKFTQIRIATGNKNIGSEAGYYQSDDESTLTVTNEDDSQGKFSHKVLQVAYQFASNNSYRGISLPVDNGYETSIASGKAGLGFWYRTESSTDKVLMYFCVSSNADADQFEALLPATNGKWQYWYIETDKVDDNTTFGFYINGSKYGKSSGVIGSEAKFWLSEVEPITPADVTVLGDETKEIAPIVRDLTIYQGGEVTNSEDVIVTRNIYYHRHAKGGALSNKLDQWYTFAVPFTVSDIEVNESSTWYDINAVYYSDNNDNQSGTPTGLGHFYLQYLSATNVSAMGSEFADRWRYITPDHSLQITGENGTRYGYPKKDSAYIILFDSDQPIGTYFQTNTEIRFVGGAQTIDGTAKEWKVESDGEQYYLYANNTLHNFTLTGSAYILNDAGTNFDLQETPTIRPFECYVQGTNALKEKYQSLPMRRPGGGGIVTGMEKTGLEDSVQVIKVIEDGRLIIIRNGRHYNAMGARVK